MRIRVGIARAGAALAALLLTSGLGGCSSGSDDGAVYEVEAAGDDELDPLPSETRKDWEETFVFDLTTVLDFDGYGSSELIAAGHLACSTLRYDYNGGTFSEIQAAVAKVESSLGVGSRDAYEVVEVANRHLCEWSHLVEDGSMELPPT